jgi:hypothetical protein
MPSSPKALAVDLMMAALLVVTAGFVAAQSSTDSTVIKGCYGKTTGVLRLLQSGSCTRLENPISWNQVGPQGPQGEQGLQGLRGEQASEGRCYGCCIK